MTPVHEPTTPPPRPVKVLVVDDHRIFASGVTKEIASEHIEVVGTAHTVDEAIAQAQALCPDVVLLDVHLPGGRGGGGAEVAAALSASTDTCAEQVRCLALSVSDAEEDVLAAIRAGARGYVTKAISSQDLINALISVSTGDAVFSPRLAGLVLDAFRTASTEPSADLNLLTPREQEVMKMIARGYTYRDAAAALFISNRTIESHVSNVLRKLQLSNRYELARWAQDRDVI